MKFKELSKHRQAELIEAERNSFCESGDNFWSECVIEDWKEKLAELGFENPEIAYSGFSSQGDGASFTSELGGKSVELPAGLQKEIDEAKQVEFTTKRLEGDWRVRTMEDLDWNLEIYGTIERNDSHYVHHRTINCTLNVSWGRDVPDALQDKLSTWSNERENELTEEARDLSQAIYKDLGEAWDYECSDETITEKLADSDDDYEEDEELELEVA